MGDLILKHGPPVRRTILLVMVFGMPVFFMWDGTADPFNVPKLALLTTGVSLAGAMRLAEVALGARPDGMRSLAWPATFISLPLIAAWLGSAYKGWSLLGHYQRYEGLIPYLLVIAAGLLLVDVFRGHPLQIAWAWTLAAAVAASYALLQAAGVDPWEQPIDLYVASTVGHGNFLGGILAISLPIVMTIWIKAYPGARFAAAATVLIAAALLVSMSQGAWAAAPAGLAVTAGYLARNRFRRATIIGGAVAAAIALLVLSSVLYSFVAPHSPLVGGTARARAQWWAAAASMGADAPLLGHGPNVYALLSPRYRTPLDALGHGDDLSDGPHSVLMSMFANAGVLGAVGFTLLFVWSVRAGRRRSPEDPMAAAFLGGAVAYFVQSLVSFDELLLAFALWVMLAGIASSSTPADTEQPPRRRAVFMIPLFLLAMASAVLGPLLAARVVRADMQALRGRAAIASGELEAGRHHLYRALAIWDQPLYRIYLAEGLGRLALARGDEGRNLLEEMREVVQPIDRLSYLPVILTEATRLHLWSTHDLAIEERALIQFERAMELDPYNPNTRVRAAEALLHLQRPQQATTTLRSLVPIMLEHPRFNTHTPPVWSVLAVAERRLGMADAATAYLDRALQEARLTGQEDSNCHVLLARIVVGEERSQTLDAAVRFSCPAVSPEALGYELGEAAESISAASP